VLQAACCEPIYRKNTPELPDGFLDVPVFTISPSKNIVKPPYLPVYTSKGPDKRTAIFGMKRAVTETIKYGQIMFLHIHQEIVRIIIHAGHQIQRITDDDFPLSPGQGGR
jgi:hypothetical protein